MKLTFFPILMFFLSYSLGINIFLEKPRSIIYRLFIIIMMVSALDDFAIMLSAILDSRIILDIMRKAGDFSFIFIPSLYLHFVFVFPERTDWLSNLSPNKRLLATTAIYIPPLIWMSVFSRQKAGMFNPNTLLGFFEALVILWTINILWQKFKKTKYIIEKKQILVVGTGLLLNIALVSLLTYFEMAHRIDVGSLQLLSPVLVFGTVGSAILSFKWANMKAILRKSMLYAALMVLIMSFYMILVRETAPFFNALFAGSSWLIEGALVFIVVLTFNPLKNHLNTIIDRLAFPDRQALLSYLPEFTRQIHLLPEKGGLLRLLMGLMKGPFHIFSVAIVLFEDRGYKLHWMGDNVLFIDHETVKSLLDHLEKNKNPIVTDESLLYPELLKKLEIYGVDLAIPIEFGEEISGLVLARRVKNEEKPRNKKALAFSFEEVDALAAAVRQVSIALSNARLFDQLKDTNARLTATIDELKQTQSRLHHADKMAALGNLSAGVAHEIRNPLGIIKLSASTLAERSEDDPESHELATFIKDEVNRLNRVVTDLLDFARPKESCPELMDLGETLKIIRKDFLPAFWDGEIIIVSPVEGHMIFVDPGQFRQIILNLVINARDACEKSKLQIPPKLRIKATVEEGGTRILVEDNGVGISVKEIDKVFDPFFTTKAKGTGLGLPIIKNIVDNHGGNISAHASSLGGTCICVFFPSYEVAQTKKE